MTAVAAQTAAPPPVLGAAAVADGVAQLLAKPEVPWRGTAHGAKFAATVMIADYGRRLVEHYGRDRAGGIDAGPFRHFGVAIEFDKAVEVAVHDAARGLDAGLRSLVAAFGPVVLRNVVLPAGSRTAEQRNVFSNCEFHIDRGANQPDHFTLFWRDPSDAAQREPRTSSTLVMANGAAYLQACREGQGGDGPTMRYRLFRNEPLAARALAGKVLVEIPWQAGVGVGEAAVLDNTTVLHASYYPVPELRGYPISVRYLA